MRGRQPCDQLCLTNWSPGRIEANNLSVTSQTNVDRRAINERKRRGLGSYRRWDWFEYDWRVQNNWARWREVFRLTQVLGAYHRRRWWDARRAGMQLNSEP